MTDESDKKRKAASELPMREATKSVLFAKIDVDSDETPTLKKGVRSVKARSHGGRRKKQIANEFPPDIVQTVRLALFEQTETLQCGANLVRNLTAQNLIPPESIARELMDVIKSFHYKTPLQTTFAGLYASALVSASARLVRRNGSAIFGPSSWDDVEVLLSQSTDRAVASAGIRLTHELQAAACGAKLLSLLLKTELLDFNLSSTNYDVGSESLRAKPTVAVLKKQGLSNVLKTATRHATKCLVRHAKFLFDSDIDMPPSSHPNHVACCASEAKTCLDNLGSVICYTAWLLCAEEKVSIEHNSAAFVIRDAFLSELSMCDDILPKTTIKTKKKMFITKLKLRFLLSLLEEFAFPLQDMVASLIEVGVELDSFDTEQLARKSSASSTSKILLENGHTFHDIYEVEAVVGHRLRDGNEEYLIKWKGYSEDENTWEPTHNLDEGVLEEARVYRMNSCPQISAVAHDHTLKRPFENGHHSKHVANDIYEVEAVVGHRLRDGNEEYLIKWKGYSEDENTWEPTHNLDEGVLEEARVYRATQISLEGQKIENDRSSPSPQKLTIAEKPKPPSSTQIFSSANQLTRVRKSSVPVLVQRQNELVEAYELEYKDSSLFWVEFVSDGKCVAVSSDKIFRGRKRKPRLSTQNDTHACRKKIKDQTLDNRLEPEDETSTKKIASVSTRSRRENGQSSKNDISGPDKLAQNEVTAATTCPEAPAADMLQIPTLFATSQDATPEQLMPQQGPHQQRNHQELDKHVTTGHDSCPIEMQVQQFLQEEPRNELQRQLQLRHNQLQQQKLQEQQKICPNLPNPFAATQVDNSGLGKLTHDEVTAAATDMLQVPILFATSQEATQEQLMPQQNSQRQNHQQLDIAFLEKNSIGGESWQSCRYCQQAFYIAPDGLSRHEVSCPVKNQVQQFFQQEPCNELQRQHNQLEGQFQLQGQQNFGSYLPYQFTAAQDAMSPHPMRTDLGLELASHQSVSMDYSQIAMPPLTHPFPQVMNACPLPPLDLVCDILQKSHFKNDCCQIIIQRGVGASDLDSLHQCHLVLYQELDLLQRISTYVYSHMAVNPGFQPLTQTLLDLQTQTSQNISELLRLINGAKSMTTPLSSERTPSPTPRTCRALFRDESVDPRHSNGKFSSGGGRKDPMPPPPACKNEAACPPQLPGTPNHSRTTETHSAWMLPPQVHDFIQKRAPSRPPRRSIHD